MSSRSSSLLDPFCRCGTGLVTPALLVGLASLLVTASSCTEKRRGPPPAPAASTEASEPRPQLLYLPDASPAEPLGSRGGAGPSIATPAPPPQATAGRCPPEMVSVRGAFCIDRYEASLLDKTSGRCLSPYYHPSPDATRREYQRWQRARPQEAPGPGRTMPVPAPPEWCLSAPRFEPMAVSVPGVVPNGYLSGQIAAAACERSGKRLCTVEEWVTACRGEKNRKFPYAHFFEASVCNVFRATHPARLLHGDASAGHLDPRLNQIDEGGDPLLRPTGGTPACASEWGLDAIYDMVGNLDEWVADPDGTFVGGFYARNTREGCDARVEVHSYDYYDYSLGARCCR